VRRRLDTIEADQEETWKENERTAPGPVATAARNMVADSAPTFLTAPAYGTDSEHGLGTMYQTSEPVILAGWSTRAGDHDNYAARLHRVMEERMLTVHATARDWGAGKNDRPQILRRRNQAAQAERDMQHEAFCRDMRHLRTRPDGWFISDLVVGYTAGRAGYQVTLSRARDNGTGMHIAYGAGGTYEEAWNQAVRNAESVGKKRKEAS
jgi:hypothetical protein